ncbi:hypothetical protein DOTSEDRAFT_57306 [Dothistroma septosporum NZE10]|uniref:Aminoglycoside phosphotransferase domain-containing protein n=1 Tax=Dothistroma septosporum (strain NZE10 / CBS 128990) TaxID=675120 RepID=M2XHT3_DOTSN|nr:hypothetical protein DOTSEDRAFT_57306 [Dothistroma septosporum NZE10]
MTYNTGVDIDLPLLTREYLIDACQSPQRDCIYSNAKAQIVRIGRFAIKFGSVSAEEIQNQLHAQALLDPTIVRVPRIYTHFQAHGVTYVVMDGIDGEQKRDIQDPGTIKAVARLVNHLHTFSSDVPGPLSRGSCSGPLWSEDERIAFTTKQQLGSYVRSRLKRLSDEFNVENTPLVFTHGDIAPRNLLFTASDIWLIDWEFAGYFPRSAEFATLRLGTGKRVEELPFYNGLEAAMLRDSPLDEVEAQQIGCWQELAVNHVRFHWLTEEQKGWRYKKPRDLNGNIVRPPAKTARSISSDWRKN